MHEPCNSSNQILECLEKMFHRSALLSNLAHKVKDQDFWTDAE